MSCKETERKIISVLRAIGVPVSKFELRVKEYSKTYYGVYRAKTNRAFVYMYKDKECTSRYSFDELMRTAIHESCHAIQWNDTKFMRKKGIMHDSDFWCMYNTLLGRYYRLKEMQEVKDATENKEYISEHSDDTISNRTTNLHSGVLCVASRRKI